MHMVLSAPQCMTVNKKGDKCIMATSGDRKKQQCSIMLFIKGYGIPSKLDNTEDD
jgi:hypothetical protein